MVSKEVSQSRRRTPLNEEAYRALVETAPDIIYALSVKNAAIVFLNPAFERITGFSCSDWIGRPFTSLIHPDDLHLATETFRQLLLGESVPRIELRIVSKRDTYVVVEIWAVPEVEDGKVTRLFGFARDVTEPKRMESALRESELEYRNLVENAGDGILIYEPETCLIIEANYKACEIYGFAKEELVGMSVKDLTKDVPRLESGIRETLETGTRANFEAVHIRKDRTEITLLVSQSLIEYGGRKAILSLRRDITERKLAEEGLRESEERYKGLVDTAFDGVVIQDGVIRFANRSYAEMYGYEIEELIGRNVLDLTPIGQRALVSSRIEDRIEAAYETLGLRKDGTIINIEVSAKNCWYRSRPARLAAVRDTTEARRAEEALRASEERYRLLFERNLAGVCRATLSGRILDCNEAFAQIFGFQSREEVLSEGVLGLYPRSGDRKALFSRLRAQRNLNTVELRLRRKDGSPVWVLGKARLVEGDDGEPTVLEGIWMDITERKLSEEELRSSRERLRDLSAHLQVVREEERTHIAREIHDQLGQTLTRLKIDLALLADELPDNHSHLLRKTVSMSMLLDSTLQTVRKISAQLRPPALDHLGVSVAVEQELLEFQQRLGIQCDLIATPEDLTLDPERSTAIFRILQEALTNVARHANATRVDVRLKKENDCVSLVISDNGRGIQRDHVYNPNSLGLIGMRERALQWGGEIEIKRGNGRGTLVELRIPLRRAVDQLDG